LLAVLGLGYLLTRPGPSRISQANCDAIQFGWTYAQVDELLGARRNEYDGWSIWEDDGGNYIIVEVAGDGRVTGKRFGTDNLSPHERLYRQARRRIREILRLPPEP
jgi:hypothetical protein